MRNLTCSITTVAQMLPIAALAPLAGCNVIDPSLLEATDAGGGTGFTLADQCTSAALITSQSEEITVNTAGLTDQIRGVQACAGTSAPGRDGFFRVLMGDGEKWHFHATSDSAQGDPIIYILDSACDERACGEGDAINACSAQDEHMSFVAPRTGMFVVALDDANPDFGGSYSLLPILPVCGDGVKEHSETCDDDTPSCDEFCRFIVTNGGSEAEPNSDPPDANVLSLTGPGTISVRADVSNECDLASFAVEVPDGGSISATILPTGATDCPATAPAMGLELIDEDLVSVLIPRGNPGIGVCPSIDGTTNAFARGLTGGTYYLRVSAPGFDQALYRYNLTVTVAGP